MVRIIAEHTLDASHWTAWFADEPHVAFGGETASNAATRLLGACPERGVDAADFHVDYERTTETHFKLIAELPVCPECGGSGRYVGLNSVEGCGACGGTGRMRLRESDRHSGLSAR